MIALTVMYYTEPGVWRARSTERWEWCVLRQNELSKRISEYNFLSWPDGKGGGKEKSVQPGDVAAGNYCGLPCKPIHNLLWLKKKRKDIEYKSTNSKTANVYLTYFNETDRKQIMWHFMCVKKKGRKNMNYHHCNYFHYWLVNQLIVWSIRYQKIVNMKVTTAPNTSWHI